jgi:hypothetical protein
LRLTHRMPPALLQYKGTIVVLCLTFVAAVSVGENRVIRRSLGVPLLLHNSKQRWRSHYPRENTSFFLCSRGETKLLFHGDTLPSFPPPASTCPSQGVTIKPATLFCFRPESHPASSDSIRQLEKQSFRHAVDRFGPSTPPLLGITKRLKPMGTRVEPSTISDAENAGAESKHCLFNKQAQMLTATFNLRPKPRANNGNVLKHARYP